MSARARTARPARAARADNPSAVIPRRTVVCLSIAQLVSWGVSYHLIAVFGERIAADLGWSRPLAYGGLTLALVVMGVCSPPAGGAIDRLGGRPPMVAGSLLNAMGCLGIATAHGVPLYYAAWACIGVGMRLTLYEAAFAALARIGGPAARRPISQITLLGGLASTVFWPVGHALAERLGWRDALVTYAALALLTVPLHLAIPGTRHGETPGGPSVAGDAPLARTRRQRAVAGGLYALIATLAGFLNSGISRTSSPSWRASALPDRFPCGSRPSGASASPRPGFGRSCSEAGSIR